MLEIKNLTKTYKPKKGVPVKALDGVSLKFPDKGMVFLLGKSGSGKSTLLNLLGGLDTYDGGEIIIKGVSSKTFKQKHFDSYRNTYIGFIFQEYNVLEEFSVGANIALSIELQGRKATDEEINSILRDVDLDGYGKRQPNELSGGQKQRVAIARALVKNPKIIMADEPTGALDSATGRQILDTLKKLSADKLVIIVSHDRDFAEKYADRIIELSDGRVINDITYTENSTDETPLIFSGKTVTVAEGYHLTEEDRIKINEYIDKLKSGAEISLGGKKSGRNSVPTDNSAIKNDIKDPFKLIKSKLPMKDAAKLGISGLKHKKFRLAITILLSVVAFSLFGVADAMSSYKHFDACAKSIKDSQITYAGFKKAEKICFSPDGFYYDRYNTKLDENDIETIKKDVGFEVRGVYLPQDGFLNFSRQIDASENEINEDYRLLDQAFGGFIETDDNYLSKLGYKVVSGRLPDGTKNEIAVSKYISELFVFAKYIQNEDDVIGKTFDFGGEEYTVVGIINTGLSLNDYLKETKTENGYEQNLIDQINSMAVQIEFTYRKTYGLSDAAFVGNGFIANLKAKMPESEPEVARLPYLSEFAAIKDVHIYPNKVLPDSSVDFASVKWLSEEKQTLADDEIIVTSDVFFDDTWESALSTDNSCVLSTEYRVGEYRVENKNVKIVGIIDGDEKEQTIVVSEKVYSSLLEKENGIYSYAVGRMPENISEIKSLVQYGDLTEATAGTVYALENAVINQTSGLNEGLKVLSSVFMWIGLGFALFAALMLSNFISVSISYKKQEIGILRAIGSRSNDVFRIFFSESFVIASVNFILASAATAVATAIINSAIRKSTFLLITVLSFGIRQIVLILFVSMLTAFLASYIPVKRIASKKPIDAIRNR